MWLSYDAKLNKIRFEESECELNRNVYTTLILASLVLLMFFVAISVVSNTDVSAARLRFQLQCRLNLINRKTWQNKAMM
jgi:hypothetical protein